MIGRSRHERETEGRKRCRRYLDWATSPVGGLEPTDVVARHLAACEDCRESQVVLAAELAGVERALDGLGTPELPDAFARETLGSLETPRWRFYSRAVWTTPAMTFVGLVLGALALLSPFPAAIASRSVPLAFLARPFETVGLVAELLLRAASDATLTPDRVGLGAVGAAVSLALFWLLARPRRERASSR